MQKKTPCSGEAFLSFSVLPFWLLSCGVRDNKNQNILLQAVVIFDKNHLVDIFLFCYFCPLALPLCLAQASADPFRSVKNTRCSDATTAFFASLETKITFPNSDTLFNSHSLRR